MTPGRTPKRNTITFMTGENPTPEGAVSATPEEQQAAKELEETMLGKDFKEQEEKLDEAEANKAA